MIAVLICALVGLSAAQTEDPCAGRAESEFFGVPGSCRLVNHCYKGVLYVRTCIDNLFWNDEKGYCTYPELSGCSEDVPIPTTTPGPVTTVVPVEPAGPECTADGIVFHPHEEACDKYFICPGKDQQPLEFACAQDYYFSKEHLQCIPSNLVQCVVKVSCPADLKEDEIDYLADPNDCASYFLCLNGQQLQFTCKNDLLWNPVVKSCDLKEKVTCGV